MKRKALGPISAGLTRIFAGKPARLIVRSLALELHTSTKASAPPFNPFKYASALDLPIERQAMESAEGILMGWPNECRIVLPPISPSCSLSYQRRENFTVAHEIGHYIIRETVRGAVPASVLSVATPDEEHLCNIFAEELLMPSLWLRNDLRDCGLKSSLIRSLCERYEVSLTTLLMRATRLLRDEWGGDVTALIWSKQRTGFELSWASPFEYQQALLCESGRTSVERAFRFRREVEGRDVILIDGVRSQWTCSSVSISSRKILTLATKAQQFFARRARSQEAVVRGKYPVQMSLPLGA